MRRATAARGRGANATRVANISARRVTRAGDAARAWGEGVHRVELRSTRVSSSIVASSSSRALVVARPSTNHEA